MAADAQTRALARRLRNLEKGRLGTKQPGLAYSAIDDGAISAVDEDGNLTAVFGKQFDGTTTAAAISGPPPPQPTAPTVVSPELNAARINWDGLFTGGAIVPMDFSRVEIHASLDPADTAETADTLVGTYETPRGGDTFVPLPAGLCYIRLVARNANGGRSVASDAATVTPTTIDDLVATPTQLAQDALDAANAAQDDATAAITAANGKNTNYYQTTMPTGGTYVVGDHWFDTDDGNHPYRYNGTTFVDAQDGDVAQASTDASTAIGNAASAAAAAATAQGTANTALSTANAKSKNTYSTSAPGATANTAGDNWFRTSGGNVIEQWRGDGGTSWTQVAINGTMLAADSVTATQIAADAITASEIAAGAVTASEIAAGTITGDKIAAKTISASRLVVTNMSNLIDAGDFEGDTSSWGGSGWAIVTTATPAVGGSKVLEMTGTGASLAAYFQPYSGRGISVSPGETYYLEARARVTDAGSTGTAKLDIIFKLDNASNQYVNASQVADMSTWTVGSWVTLSGIVTVPAGANEMTPELTTANLNAGKHLQWDNVVVRKATDASLIVDGSVIAGKIAAGAVTANKLSVIVGGGNLLPNSAFLNAAANRPGFGNTTVATESTTTYRNGKAVRVTSSNATNPFGIGVTHTTSAQSFALLPNTVYQASAWIYNPSSGGVTDVRVDVTGAGVASQVMGITTTKDAWTRVTSSFTTGASPTAGSWSFTVKSNGSPALGATYVIGAVQLEQGDVPTAYSPMADEILPGTIQASQIAAGTITSASGVIGALDAGAITTGTLDANRIGAKTVTTDKLIIGSFDNLLQDPSFEKALGTCWQTQSYAAIAAGVARNGGPVMRITNTAAANDVYNLPQDNVRVDGTISGEEQDNLIQDGDVNGTGSWALAAGFTIASGLSTVAPGDSNGKAIRYTAGNAYAQITEPVFPVTPNETFTLDYQYRRSGTTSTGGAIAPLVFFYDSTGAFISTGGSPDLSAPAIPLTWTLGSGTITAPSNAVTAQVVLRATAGIDGGGLYDFDQLRLRRTTKITAPSDTKSGDSFLLSWWAKSSAAQTGQITMKARFKLKDGTFQTFAAGEDQSCSANTWTQYNGLVTAPKDSVSVSFYLSTSASLSTGTVDFDYASATRAMVGSLIVDGEIRGQHIEAGSIETRHLVADFFEAGFVYTGAIQIGNITINPTDGMTIPGPDGTTHLPTDGSGNTFAGVIVTSSAQIKDDLTLSGSSLFNGTVNLANGVSSPVTAPTIAQYYPSQYGAFGDGSQDVSTFNAGLADYHGSTTEFVYSSIFFGTNIRRVRKSDYGWAGDISGGWSSNFYGWGGIAMMGGDYYIIGSDNDRNVDVYIYRIKGSDGTKTSDFRIGNSGAFNGFKPRLVADTVNNRIGMIWIPLSGNLMLRWYNSSFAQVGNDITLQAAVGQQDIGGAYFGDGGAGLGASTLYVALRKINSNAGRVMVWTSVTTTSATRSSSIDFKHANNTQVIGMNYDATQGRMIHYDAYGAIWTYSKLNASSGTAPTIQAAYTWWDGDNSVYPAGTVINGVDKSGQASSTHETLPSPTASLSIERRSWFTVTTPAAPDEKITNSQMVDKANRIGLYIAQQGGTLRKYAAPTSDGYLALGVHSFTAAPATNGDIMPTTGAVPTSNSFTTGANPAFISAGQINSLAVRQDGQPKNHIGGDGTANLDGLIPPGTIMMWGGSLGIPLPKGWLLCDGTNYTVSQYPDLYAAITTTYGGSTGLNFNVPNTTNKFVRGTATVPGGQGGQDTLPDHTHGVGTYGTSTIDLNLQTNTSTGGSANRLTQQNHSHSITGNSGIVIGSNPSILPSYISFRYIIKT